MDTMGRDGPLLRARGLGKEYGKGDGLVRAVGGVDERNRCRRQRQWWIHHPGNPQSLRLDQATPVVSVMLIVLAAVNTTFIAWSTALEARHSSALARALDATPRQVNTGLAMAQMLPALAGALLGIPCGVGIYDAASNGGSTTIPPAWWLAAMGSGPWP